MKNIITIIALFIVSFALFAGVGSLLFNGEAPPNSLQAAVTFNGINFLAMFIYFILSVITTTILFLTLKNKRKKQSA